MNDNPPPGLARQLAGLLGDVSGLVAVVVAYLLAISGRSPGPIPNTTSIVTVAVTTIVVWVWRANRVTRRVPQASAGSNAASAEGGPNRRHRSLLEPLRGQGVPPYAMSLRRRQTELAGLAALTLAAVLWSAGRASDAIPELTGLRANPVPAVVCWPAATSLGPRVVIADFEDAAPQYASLLENRLFDTLTDGAPAGRTVCRLRQVVGTRQEAQTIGRQTQAVLVVWGRSDVVFDVHLELANSKSAAWSVAGRNLPPLPAQELADAGFALREPLRLGFLADLVVSQALYLNNQSPEARQLLAGALGRAEAEDLARDNAADVGEAYFLLGYMYDPYVDRSQGDAQVALAAYSRSLELNPSLDAAALNRAMVYASLGDMDQAFAGLDALIAGRGQLAADAAVNRAFLKPDRAAAEQDFALAIQLNAVLGYWHRGNARQHFWGDLPGALADYEAAVKLAPPESFYYESLGEAQLKAGRHAEARKAYRDVAERLDAPGRQALVERLGTLATENPDLSGAIGIIVADLQGAP